MWWIAIIVLAFLLPELISTVLDSRLGRAMAHRLEAGGGANDEAPLKERLRFLEGEVDRLSDDVHRLREESDFLQRLLTERSSGGSSTAPSSEPRIPPGDRAD